MQNKSLYWSIRLTIGGLGIITLYQVVPHLTKLLQYLVDLYKLTNTSPEFRMLLVCLSIWVTCSIINTITNLIFKVHGLLEDKFIIKTKPNNEL